ncbi:CDP-diacylglycerol--glycerol-3-phosphate 3-phosphatidyltransferase [Candidatus Rubidus massiliensis]|nr:MAG: hypothetical protein BGO10_05725 [Chlamydia sp. 32-24]CDZ79512.1 CDP-diacylglycerol--glycerol-3-phosphate 3-phosphatidyltransferase [Candidatus Rubidus massiliensis]
MALTLPNLLSFLRIPLAFFFLQENIAIRFGAIIVAMISDGLDGFLARRYNVTSRFGTLLDPIADKFFVAFALTTLVLEQRMTGMQAALFLCRDMSVLLFGIFLIAKNELYNYQFKAIICGKITTFLQFVFLVCLSLQIPIPTFGYISFIVLGLLALVELFFSVKRSKIS